MRLLGISALVVATAACGSSNDTSTVDVGSATEPPTSVGSCEPNAAATGNALHVGAYCTPNGGQCSAYASASLLCSVDLDPRGGNFCLLLGCQTHADCGARSCCTGDPGVSLHACVPIECLVNAGVCPALP